MPFREGAGREQMIGPQVRYIEDVRSAFRRRKKDTGNTGKNGLGFDEHDVGPGYSQAEQQSAAHERDLAQQLATDPRAGRSFEPGLNHPDSFQIGHDHGLAAVVAMDETLRIMGQAGEDGDLVAAPVQFLGQTRETHRRCAGFRREIVRDDQDVHAPRGTWPGAEGCSIPDHHRLAPSRNARGPSSAWAARWMLIYGFEERCTRSQP